MTASTSVRILGVAAPVVFGSAGVAWLVGRWGWDPAALVVFGVSAAALLVLSGRGDETRPRDSFRLPVAPAYQAWCSATVLGFVVFHFHSPEASYIPIFDTLDGTLPIYALLGSLPVFDGLDASVPQLLGGVPKNSVYSQLNLYAALFRLFPPAHAYIANDVIMRAVGLAGMLLLLRRQLAPGASDLAVAGAATAFALLPHLSSACLSVAGLPLLLCAVLELLGGSRSRWPWAVVALFPFASMLPLVGWVVLAVLAGVVVVDAIRRRRMPWRGAVVLGVLAVGYVVSDYRLLYQLVLDPAYVSQRVEFGPLLSFSYDGEGLARSVVHHARKGFPHAASLHDPVVLVAVAAGLVFAVGSLGTGRRMRLAACLAAIAFSSLIFAISFNRPWQEWQLATNLGPFRTLHLSRLGWWEPLVWYAAFALALDVLARRRPARAAAAVLVALQVTLVFFTNDFYERKDALGIRFGEFTSAPLFSEIREHIGRPVSEYRVASLGMPASLATYNGFYTADGYLGNYPLDYKHRFRRLIAAELNKNGRLKRGFDLWGARCHVLSHELSRGGGPNFPGYTKHHKRRRVRRLALDPAALADLGIDYLLSAVKIVSPERSGLAPVRVFERDDSPWEIHLYERAPPGRTLRGRR